MQLETDELSQELGREIRGHDFLVNRVIRPYIGLACEGEMMTKNFFDQMDARIAKYDLLCHPFYKAWAAGELTREDLRSYGQHYFHHVRAFPAHLKAFAARVKDDSLRRAVLVNHEDEMGHDGARPHAELWMDFVEGMGGERDGNGHQALPEINQMMEYFHFVACEGASEEALAAFYAYESQVPRVSSEKARGLREMYGANEETCEYFTLHTTADIYHSRIWKHQLAKLVAGNPAAAEKALNAGENAAKAQWKALDGIESARMARAA